jgi:predicted enzyme related to lactoylglutathione lyase
VTKNKVVHFEIPVSDFKKAKSFYEAVFDWKVSLHGDEGAMAETTPVDEKYMPKELGGINGGFYKRTSPAQQPSFVVHTESLDETIAKIEKAGGKITGPKHQAGEWGYMAEFKDPEGNEITIWEPPAHMK